jgi:hypothetical protein
MHRISLVHQAGALRSYFPDSEIIRKGENELVWVAHITPSPLSEIYRVKLHYKRGKFIKVLVLEPKLKLAEGKDKLPHVYSTPEQQLCLYFPKNNEWHTGMFYVKSLIPWASEWLYHYEFWVGSGEWHGGGIDHEEAAEESNIEEHEIGPYND